MSDGSKETIVVGVDGSEHSIEALRWAARQAKVTGARLDVVTAWTFPNEPTPFGIVPDLPLRPEQLAEVEATLREVVGRIVTPAWGVEVKAEVISGHAAVVLTQASREAALLVVGSRGRGAVAEVLLGSVSEHCVRHASCPVVVIRQSLRR
jgi:nucleotide-binding universal stress UspA family protein